MHNCIRICSQQYKRCYSAVLNYELLAGVSFNPPPHSKVFEILTSAFEAVSTATQTMMQSFNDRLMADKMMAILRSLALTMQYMDGFKATYSIRLKHIAKTLTESVKAAENSLVHMQTTGRHKKVFSMKLGESSTNLVSLEPNKKGADSVNLDSDSSPDIKSSAASQIRSQPQSRRLSFI